VGSCMHNDSSMQFSKQVQAAPQNVDLDRSQARLLRLLAREREDISATCIVAVQGCCERISDGHV
jgi:hypothetical protein